MLKSEDRRINSMEEFEKQIKYLPIYGAVTYFFGYLVLSSRLAYLKIFIKDFFALDYLKTGLLFLFITIPIVLICIESMKSKYWILRFLLSVIFGASLIFFLTPIIFVDRSDSTILTDFLTFAFYPLEVFIFVLLSKKYLTNLKKYDAFNSTITICLLLVMLTSFGNFIFPQIKFRFGGGAPYSKILYILDEKGIENEINARIFYENETWIYYKSENKTIISLPKKRIIKEKSLTEESSLNWYFNQ